ncbi:unnamed protein product [Brassica napus]|uniref:(rape) hypothetical protein n=1 Tax=Brassica napus TaxID=3708 RepID=A0A816I2G7_BRANA|nr:unnamed protein product [Brassica napus]
MKTEILTLNISHTVHISNYINNPCISYLVEKKQLDL